VIPAFTAGGSVAVLVLGVNASIGAWWHHA
jgi:hypothetical protein